MHIGVETKLKCGPEKDYKNVKLPKNSRPYIHSWKGLGQRSDQKLNSDSGDPTQRL